MGNSNIESKSGYDEIIKLMPPFTAALSAVPRKIRDNACEIRVRAGRCTVIETLDERFICGQHKASAEEISACVKRFCDFSIYSCERELAEGWITLRGGHRAGFAGTAVTRGGRIETVRDISSLNVRIASERIGSAEKLFSLSAFRKDLSGLLILGPPMSGKTTVLRDYCRLLSAFRKTALIDERGEVAAVYGGVPQNDVGANCDVLNCFPKSEGIMTALRSLSPEYIICDEAGREYRELAECAGKGVKLILTAHCGSMAEAARNKTVRFLIENAAVNFIALLGKGRRAGRTEGLWKIDDVGDISLCGDNDDLCRDRGGAVALA